MPAIGATHLRSFARLVLGTGLVLVGVTHLTVARNAFLAQVPDWVGVDKDLVVVVSGVIEITLGTALLLARRHRPLVGLVVGLFFIAIFPGNLSQYIDGHDAFGLTSDSARRNRLFFQPVLIAWAWWCTGARAVVFHRRRD